MQQHLSCLVIREVLFCLALATSRVEVGEGFHYKTVLVFILLVNLSKGSQKSAQEHKGSSRYFQICLKVFQASFFLLIEQKW